MRVRRTVLLVVSLAAAVLPTGTTGAATPDPTKPAATPAATCDAGSRPETGVQGDIPQSDIDSGRVDQGYFCNARFISRIGPSGGYRVERYVDHSGHVCAYFDSSLLFPG